MTEPEVDCPLEHVVIHRERFEEATQAVDRQSAGFTTRRHVEPADQSDEAIVQILRVAR